MRWTEHLHKLIQVLGFRDPKACFASGQFQDTFRRIWSYFSSVVFHSQEAFAAYCREPSGMATLRELPLMPIAPKREKLLGEARATAAREAQAAALRAPRHDELCGTGMAMPCERCL